jgi:hypothetical protein
MRAFSLAESFDATRERKYGHPVRISVRLRPRFCAWRARPPIRRFIPPNPLDGAESAFRVWIEGGQHECYGEFTFAGQQRLCVGGTCRQQDLRCLVTRLGCREDVHERSEERSGDRWRKWR